MRINFGSCYDNSGSLQNSKVELAAATAQSGGVNLKSPHKPANCASVLHTEGGHDVC